MPDQALARAGLGDGDAVLGKSLGQPASALAERETAKAASSYANRQRIAYTRMWFYRHCIAAPKSCGNRQ
jgi:hypothetical protein